MAARQRPSPPGNPAGDKRRPAVHTAAMHITSTSPGAAWRLAFCAGLAAAALSLPSRAQIVVEKAMKADEATAACERKVRQTLATRAEAPADLAFAGPATAAPADLPGDGPAVLRGEGHWRARDGVRKFSYSCNVDLRTAEIHGVVMRDLTPVVAKAAPARRTAEPDLSNVSVAACESTVVQALKRRWPLVSQIAFDPATRIIRQETSESAELHGRGRALPSQGAPSTLFGFDCAIDPRDGQVVSTRLSS